MWKIILIFTLIGFLDLSSAQLVELGQCNENIALVQNFNLTAFEGTWYEYQAYPKEQQTGQCIQHRYDYNPNTGRLTLESLSVTDKFLSLSNSILSYSSADQNGRLILTQLTPDGEISLPFWILGVNYQDYALAYSCVNIDENFRRIFSWKLTRTKGVLSAAANNAINTIMSNQMVLHDNYFEYIDQSEDACFFLPDISSGEPVILPGQCDPNIPVVQNFDANRYSGRWRLIQSYFTQFQSGTCNEATYTLLSNNTLSVQNSLVNNQVLQTIQGTAVLATNDGSAKLLVTFPHTPLPAELWVLGTDYESYALVYSCINLNSETKRVWSWKLSRTNDLSASAVASISNIMNNINVLDDRYFQTVDRSAAACFYLPDLGPNDPVVFRGQCDPNIPVVQNFDATRYSGTWRLIQSYFTQFQSGTCNEATYNLLSNNTLSVQNSVVTNQLLRSIQGTAVLATNDGSAKLLVTFPHTPQPAELWVLGTDYESYALVYSCVNLNSETKRVWSWKLSRTNELSASAVASISSITNNINVLDDRYFQTVDRSAAACFYLPDLGPNDPVVFRGQCDPNIPVVQNFDATRYSGTWRLIQSYFTQFQSGTCNEATYNLLSNNTLSVQNSVVTNQLLRSIQGTAVLATNDGSAKLLVTFPHTPQPAELWVLGTDYESYALVYSCVNLNSETKRVWSWKLSRTNELSASAVASISSITNNINVLDDRYFQTVDRSAAACFYLPDLGPNDPVVFRGQCDPNIPVVQNFDATRYSGTWRLIQSYFTQFQSGTCNEATYTLLSNNTLSVQNSLVNNQLLQTIQGTAVLATNDGSAKLLVTFPHTPQPAELWVLGTDYESYALVYSCVNLNSETKRVWSWKLSRTNELSASSDASISSIMNNINVLDDRYFQTVDRSAAACFYLPDLGPNDPVVFRGQCDPNIPVVQNFDATRYSGTWRLIQSYFTQFQSGTCNEATYTLLSNNTLSVQNSLVNNQLLQTIQGTAVLATNDGSAKLLVTFPHTPQPAELWVLGTDYESYALVYSCVNLNSETKRVWSWKLSRTNELSASADASISSIMNNINVLDDRYFQTVDRSAAACFYLPDLGPNDPVVFRGQCDPNIPVVQNFDATRYSGTWRLIQSYFTQFQSGTCNEAIYTLLPNNTLSVQNSVVTNQLLRTIQGTAVLATNDGSAKLLVTFPHTPQPAELWVLGTDYESYALVYSCVNLNSETKRVWSWKLSRTNELSASAVASISNITNNINVLDDRYFQTVDRSAAACFYLPDLGPNDPVVFRGQCDPNIPVVQNFDATRYSGTWRLIQSYFTHFQSGTCNKATYTLLSNNTLSVQNSQVNNQVLQTIQGTAILTTNDGSAKLLVTFPNRPGSAELWILGTDYESYALVYRCINLNSETKRVWSWKLSRTNELSASAVASITNITNNINVLDDRYFRTVNRSEAACFYYPTPDGNPVRLRGQCDQNIPVVNNFDVGRYSGTWFQIERYPQRYENGTCTGARYTPNQDTGVVSVLNWQVIGDTLDTVEGTANVTSTDGSARLRVRLPVRWTGEANPPMVERDLWVLTTDYTNYSLVYSCVNINQYERSVSAWKLSRTRTMSAAGTAAINAYMETRQELHQPLFLQVVQNDDCLEPSSAFVFQSSIIILLICAFLQILV